MHLRPVVRRLTILWMVAVALAATMTILHREAQACAQRHERKFLRPLVRVRLGSTA
jgi:hypothetical protein